MVILRAGNKIKSARDILYKHSSTEFLHLLNGVTPNPIVTDIISNINNERNKNKDDTEMLGDAFREVPGETKQNRSYSPKEELQEVCKIYQPSDSTSRQLSFGSDESNRDDDDDDDVDDGSGFDDDDVDDGSGFEGAKQMTPDEILTQISQKSTELIRLIDNIVT